MFAAVEVPGTDRSDLEQLTSDFTEHVDLIETRAFDGIAALHALIPISLASIPVLKAWLIARSEQRKSTSIRWNGNRLTGYSRDDALRIIEAVERSVRPSESLPSEVKTKAKRRTTKKHND